MSIKSILTLLVALAMISPVMAKNKKDKTFKGKLISITEEQLVVKIRGDEKTYKINEDVKIYNKDGEEVAVEDVKFRMITIKTDPEDKEKITEIKEFKRKGNGNKKKGGKKKKKTDDSDKDGSDE